MAYVVTLIDWTLSLRQVVRLLADAELVFRPPSEAVPLSLRIVQGRGGGFKVAWPKEVLWNGPPPVLSTEAGRIDVANFHWSEPHYYGTLSVDLVSDQELEERARERMDRLVSMLGARVRLKRAVRVRGGSYLIGKEFVVYGVNRDDCLLLKDPTLGCPNSRLLRLDPSAVEVLP
jgi:hypothetical protein